VNEQLVPRVGNVRKLSGWTPAPPMKFNFGFAAKDVGLGL